MARRKVARKAQEEVVVEKQPWNIYSMMLLLSFLALVIGTVVLVFELEAYHWKVAPPKGSLSAAATQSANDRAAELPTNRVA